MKAGATDEPVAARFAVGMGDSPRFSITADRLDACAGDDVAAREVNFVREHFADARVVGNAFLRNVDGSLSCSVGLNFAEFFGGQHAEAFETVLCPAVKKAREPFNFFPRGCDDYFSADVMRDRVFMTEFDHLPDASDG